MAAERKVEVYQIRLSKTEREVLRRRARKAGMTEADHLRACMMLEAIFSGDAEALKELGGKFREAFAARIKYLEEQGVQVF